MHHFTYKNGTMHAEDVSLAVLSETVGTPFYVYSTATLTRHYQVFAEAFADMNALICYAVKANSNVAVLKCLADQGSGMDVVSGGELARAIAAGVPGEKICFSGVGKTADEMAQALDANILCFNVESEAEFHLLNEVALQKGVKAPIAMRVNPDVDAKTHAKISTGKAENKFGIPFDLARTLYSRAVSMEGLNVCGIHMHIGSQITELAPFENAFLLLRQLVTDLTTDGIDLTHIDLGGGLGIPYCAEDTPPSPQEYAAVVQKTVGTLGLKLILEPGRLIVGNAGALITKTLFVKQGEKKDFLIIDGAMNDLVRPTLYEALHDITPVNEARLKGKSTLYDVVGPVCETGDFLAQDRKLPHIEQGDLLAVMSAGAYGATLASTYNTRALVPEVLVNGSEHCVIRPRQSVEDLLALEQMPDWLSA